MATFVMTDITYSVFVVLMFKGFVTRLAFVTYIISLYLAISGSVLTITNRG